MNSIKSKKSTSLSILLLLKNINYKKIEIKNSCCKWKSGSQDIMLLIKVNPSNCKQ